MAEPPRLADVAVPPPFYLRQVRSPGGWGDATKPREQRLTEALRTVFSGEPPYSVFLVRDDSEYRRAVMALYSGRIKLEGHLTFLPLRAEALDAAAVRVTRSDGVTRCDEANLRLHYDADADEGQLRSLCNALMDAGQPSTRLSEKALLDWLVATRVEGCKSGRETDVCRVAGCGVRP